MAMTLRVVVPPHPLIAHWLTMLRIETTPPVLYATALEELGRWLTYEAIRDWLPHRSEEINTNQSKTQGTVIESGVKLIALPLIPSGIEIWQGARKVLPNSQLCLGKVPKAIETSTGMIIFLNQIATGEKLLDTLILLKNQNINSKRIRIITALASNPGLQRIGERFNDLTIYTASIDPEITKDGDIIPGIGNPACRLNSYL